MSRRFAIIPARALDDERITNADLRILCAFGRETDKNGWCKVKQQTIADAVSYSRQYVCERIGHLVDIDYLEQHYAIRDGRGRGPSRYRLMFDFDAPPDADSEAPKSEAEADVATVDTGPPMSPLELTAVVNTEFTPKDTFRSSSPKDTVVISASARKSIQDAVSDVAGNALNPKSMRILLCHEPVEWVIGENPCDLFLDVLPVVTALSQNVPPHSISSWNYYKNAVFEARDARLHAEKNPEPKDLSHGNYQNKKPESANARRQAEQVDGFRRAIESFTE